MHQIAFVITCKGRLHHLRQTIPAIVEQAPAEIIVVDYGCPDNTGDWVEANYPDVKVVRVGDDPGFCLPRARNIGARNSTTPWICFIDADIRINPGWLDWMNSHLAAGCFYRAAPDGGVRNNETFGTVICPRIPFEQIGGYDEAFRGWGGEDTDLYLRLTDEMKLKEAAYPSSFVEPISHDDSERTKFHDIKKRETQHLINVSYIRIKQHLLREHVDQLPIDVRSDMMEQLKRQLGRHQEGHRKTYSVVLEIKQLVARDGKQQDLLVELKKQRRFVLFGARKLRIRARPARRSGVS